MSEPVILAWSGGKDSTLALHELRHSPEYEVLGLLTTVTREYGRISMHGVRRALLEDQARSLGLPLSMAEIGTGATNASYEAAMEAALAEHRDAGIRTVAFGDLFLEEIRRYREAQLARAEMQAIFPLWGRDTTNLARHFLGLGYRAFAVCVDTHALDSSFAGREYDDAFLQDLPPGADLCGENGEFHTFVYDGPLFRFPVACERGERVLRDERFQFCDLLPAAAEHREDRAAPTPGRDLER